ncbi:MAG: heparinase II/III family protein [Terracidiphilus sp.]
MDSELNGEGMNRRTLVKLMALASSGILRSPLLAGAEQQRPAVHEPTSGTHSGHPRLFYNSASLKQIQRMLEADTAADAALKQKGDELLRAEFVPESVAEIGGGQQANYVTPARQIADMGLSLGLLFHLTGNRKYAERLRDALLYYGGYMRWCGPGLAQRIPPWHSVLETALFGLGYSAGYDALRNDLTDADRKKIAGIMVRLAVEPILNDWILPGKRIHSLDSMGHNWWGVCVSGTGLCGLALLGDEPRAQSWIDAVDAGYIEWFNYRGNVLQNRMRTFEASGPSYEGVNYTNYGVSQYLNYRFAWQNTFPGKKAARIEPLEHIATYFLQTLYPSSSGFLTVNFDDAPPAVDITETLLLLAACGFSNRDVARYLKLVHSAPQGTLLTILRQFPRPMAQGNAPTSCIYPQMGWATMRSSWEDDTTFLAMKSGYTWNHAHADAGSFILFKQGKSLIIDSGTCKYSRPEYSTYYRRSRAHNVILFNGQGQPEEDIGLGCKFPGHMHSLIDGHGLKYIYADATGPMARWFTRNYRHWFWSGDLILIFDDVRSHTAGQMDWLLHYDGSYTSDSTGIRLKNGPAEATVKMLYPAYGLREDVGLADHDPDRKIPYLVFTASAPAQTQQFLTAVCLNTEAVPRFEVIEEQDYLGVRIETQDAMEEFYLSRRAINSPGTQDIQLGNWTTDAYLLHLRRPSAGATVERYFMGCGSYLRSSSRSLIESLSKVTACWSPGDPLEILTDDGSASIQLAAESMPRKALWNGQPVRHEYDRQSELLLLKRLPGEGKVRNGEK